MRRSLGSRVRCGGGGAASRPDGIVSGPSRAAARQRAVRPAQPTRRSSRLLSHSTRLGTAVTDTWPRVTVGQKNGGRYEFSNGDHLSTGWRRGEEESWNTKHLLVYRFVCAFEWHDEWGRWWAAREAMAIGRRSAVESVSAAVWPTNSYLDICMSPPRRQIDTLLHLCIVIDICSFLCLTDRARDVETVQSQSPSLGQPPRSPSVSSRSVNAVEGACACQTACCS